MNPILRSILLGLAAGAAALPAHAASPDPQKTRQLVAVVQTTADLAERARALQQLALVASKDAIPALTALLADEKLGQYARDVLEVMPDPAAGDALRAALGQQKGKALIGVVNSLGMRRDAKAVDALGRLAADPAAGAAAPALLALGRIATPEALRIVEPAIARGPAELRAAAAEAGLIAADRLREDGKGAAALAIYEKIRGADLPLPWRVAATRGVIFNAGSRGPALLIEQLHATEIDLRDVALRAIRELKDPQVTPRLVAELDKLAPPLQALVIAALVDRGEGGALAAVEARVKAGDEAVRLAAVKALGKTGRASSLPLLLQAAAGGGLLADAALVSLTRIPAPETGSFLLQSLPAVEPALRVRLIGVLGDRKAEGATAALMALATGPDLEVAKAAWRALGPLSRPADLPQLIRLAIAVQDEAAKTLADHAIVTTSMKVLEPAKRADAVLAAFRAATEPAVKAALVRPLWATARAMGGSHDAFFALRTALADRVDEVRAAALRALASWPNATPVTTLLEFANHPATPPEQREIAWRGALGRIDNVSAGRERSSLDPVAALAYAARTARTTEEKVAVIAAIADVRRPEATGLLKPFLEDPALRVEAGAAAKKIAGGNGAAKGKGKKAAAPAAPPAGRSGPLFNGSDLGNWDGDPGVWRVRDGAIVGGSLEGNPRNEFLATTRRYRNFVLTLDYKLAGTEGFVNGGVQFRSVRVAQPPNEMSGYQADIGAGHSGSLYDESRRKKFLARATEEQVKRFERPGDWNRYEIRCEGARVELTLNGEKTVAWVEEDAAIAAVDGLIALQIHGNCKAEIAFRSLTVTELP